MLYLMLVVVFSRLSKKWWFFLLLGWGKHNSVLPLYSACNEVPEFIASFVKSFITLMTVSDLIMLFYVLTADTICRGYKMSYTCLPCSFVPGSTASKQKSV